MRARGDAPAPHAARLGRRAFVASLLALRAASALGRRPYGGRLRLSLPLSFGFLDPHADGHAASALFSAAFADPLYALDSQGRPYPALAASLPAAEGPGSRVELRPGLVTGAGKPLDARDVAASIDRARRGAAAPLLPAFGRIRIAGEAKLTLLFPDAGPELVGEALSCPATLIVPKGFSPETPDGTGPFRVRRSRDGFVLERNERAARGPAFLEAIELRRTDGLAAALRAFESGDADVGFLGSGLHRPRPGAVALATPPAGFIVLRSGQGAGSWGAPGVAARLVEGIPRDRLAHLGLDLPGGGADAGWGGPPGDVLVESGSQYLVEIAGVVAAVLSRQGHELRPLPLPLSELRARVRSGKYVLALDVVRRLGTSPRHTLLALLAAADPRLAERPPNLTTVDPRAVSRTLPLAVLGDLALRGAAAPGLNGLAEWDLGAVWRSLLTRETALTGETGSASWDWFSGGLDPPQLAIATAPPA